MIGKQIRLERIMNRDTGRTIIVPMDHGVTAGPIRGLEDMRETVTKVVNGGANAILMHKGMVQAGHRRGGRDIGLIVHLSAGTTLSPEHQGAGVHGGGSHQAGGGRGLDSREPGRVDRCGYDARLR